MTTADEEIRQVRAACAFLSAHSEYLVTHERNVAATLRAYPGYLQVRGLAAPLPPTAAAQAPAAARLAAPPPPPAGLTEAQMLAEIQPDVVYARRRDEVLARARGTRGPGAEAAPPAAESLNPEAVYAARRAAVAGGRP